MKTSSIGITACAVGAAAALLTAGNVEAGSAASLKIDGGVAQTFTFDRPFGAEAPTTNPSTPTSPPTTYSAGVRRPPQLAAEHTVPSAPTTVNPDPEPPETTTSPTPEPTTPGPTAE